jgi:hypothetical protein
MKPQSLATRSTAKARAIVFNATETVIGFPVKLIKNESMVISPSLS